MRLSRWLTLSHWFVCELNKKKTKNVKFFIVNVKNVSTKKYVGIQIYIYRIEKNMQFIFRFFPKIIIVFENIFVYSCFLIFITILKKTYLFVSLLFYLFFITNMRNQSSVLCQSHTTLISARGFTFNIFKIRDFVFSVTWPLLFCQIRLYCGKKIANFS